MDSVAYIYIHRYSTYKAIKNHFFMLDFCYFVQVSAVLQSLMCWVGSDSGFCSSWFKANFVLSHGPLAVAILAWQNSIVFHSLDKMTSFYIHIMPALTCYLQRWDVIPGSIPAEGLSLSFTEAIITPMMLYSAWQVSLHRVLTHLKRFTHLFRQFICTFNTQSSTRIWTLLPL